MGFGSSTAQYWGKPANSVIVEGMSGTNCTDKTDIRLEYNTDDTTAPTLIRYADGRTSVSTGKTVSTAGYTVGALPLAGTTKSYYCTCEVWGQKTYIGGELVQDLRPYIDGDGVACFKDVVTDTLFYNQGTGTLTYTEFEPQEFIYLNGNQYIDTGITYQTCTINTAIKYNAGLNARMLSGWSDIQATYWGMNTNECLELGGGIVATGINLTEYSVLNIYVDATNETITASVGDTSISRVGDQPNGVPTYKIGCSTTTSSNKVIGNVYYHKVYDVDGKLVRDMIPVNRSDGVVCMYDRVENKYYELKGA
jgi:hypothetical protein